MSAEQGRAWTWRHQILRSDLPSTTRHVLLTLSCFMNDVGGGCYPTQETLAEASGLTARAVRTHLEIAESKGWLRRDEHGFRGKRWRSTEYWALWPDPLHVDEGAERGSSPVSPTCGTSRQKVRNDVPTILPEQSNSPLPQTASETPALDVEGRKVHSIDEEELYRACCKVAGRSPGITSRDGSWFFRQSVIDAAKAAMPNEP